MMKKHISALLIGLLALVLVFSGCARVTAILDQNFPQDTEAVQNDPDPDDILPDRAKRTYTVLLTTQLERPEKLTGVSILTFDTANDKVHWLELPVDLFIHATGSDLKGHYGNAYHLEVIKEGATTLSATHAGINALRKLITTGYNISIDYSINLDSEQFTDLIKVIGSVPITLTKSMGGFAAGSQTLSASSATSFLTYNQYSDAVNDKMEAHMQFAAAFWQQARTKITAEKLSLISMEIRSLLGW